MPRTVRAGQLAEGYDRLRSCWSIGRGLQYGRARQLAERASAGRLEEGDGRVGQPYVK